MTDIPTLERTRGGHKGQLTKYQIIAENHENQTKIISQDECEALLHKLQQLDEKIGRLNEKVFELCTTSDETTKAVDAADEFEMKLISVSSRFKVILKSFSTSSTTSTSSAGAASLVKLPRIDLPSFDGRYENWQSFQDLFIATVDNNKSLSGAQKLQYLKSCLKGEAANLIKSFTVTDTHYREAWGLMTDRYDNKREITHSLIKRIYNQPHIKQESAASLQNILDLTTECLRSLKVLHRPVDSWDDIIVFLVVEKLDPETRREWAMSLKGTDPPTYKDLQDFLEQHIRGLQAGGHKISPRDNQRDRRTPYHTNQTSTHHVSTESCPVCKENHFIYHCPTFKSLSPEERSNKVRSAAHCTNCLRLHPTKDCTSTGSCKKCNKRHNTLLHFDKKQIKPQPEKSSISSHGTAIASNQAVQTLLKTALIKIADHNNEFKIVRAFLDDGSEASIVTEECVKALGLSKQRSNTEITGVASAKVGTSKFTTILKLSSLVYQASLEVEALILPKITAPRPKLPCNPSTWTHLNGLELADPNFDKPGKIDILLGAEAVAALLREGVKQGPQNSPTAQHTVLGWVLFGKVSTSIHQPIVRVHHISTNIDSIVEKFWTIEELPFTRHFTPEEKKCEQHFLSTHSRDASGRYVVRLPFNDKVHNLGLSRDQAVRRLLQLEKRFLRTPEHKEPYLKFMQEYQSLKHMEIIPENNQLSSKAFYLPHHFVLKLNSTTTKFRVVFDGSAKSSTGVSLNNTLMVGPTIQDDLFTLLLRFRTHIIALKADITKMYRQFKVADEDRDYQRILWRETSSQPIREYQLNTITYGTASAPFQATRCLQQLTLDEISNFPLASKLLSSDMYVDDLISGAASTEQAMQIQQQLSKLVSRGGMEIRKWMSSDPVVLQSIPVDLRDKQDSFDLDGDSNSVQALGVQWRPGADTFTFSTNPTTTTNTITKRQLLSELAKVFDPLGFLSPVTINAKLMFQDLWKEKVDWDEPLSATISSRWTTYQTQLPMIQTLQIPRCIVIPNPITQELHGFSDASEKAYAAVIYLKSTTADGTSVVKQIASKTRVAPVQQVSLPRLELCAALLLTDLIINVKEACKLTCPISTWSDSMIVLKWLASFPGRWKTFIANRVAKIQDALPMDSWHHVRSEDNPADCASRGITPEELVNHLLWWHGPSWLTSPDLPSFPVDEDMNAVLKEEKTKTVTVAHLFTDQSLINKYSSLRTLVRVTALMLRFTNNCKNKEQKKTSELNPLELQSALKILIKITQTIQFEREICCLKQKIPLPTKSKIKQLNPFIDGEGVLRVGGRLQNSNLPEDGKHPIIIPHNSHLTWLIIHSCHVQTLHGGFQLMFSTLSQEYWITHARDTIRQIIRKCIPCRRQRAEMAQQLMGSLPSSRVNPGPPFLNTGVDYAGPFSLLKTRGRGAKSFKGYFAVFICFATKAVHLEVVTDLTSNAFLASFKRFSARRGRPSHMYSDCGTNFVGADKELKKMLESANHNNLVGHKLADEGTTWHFNPPGAPHQGGLWEAGVKAVKFHLRRIIGNNNLTLEEFQTLLCNVEAILNSRPLCALSPDPEDLSVLTPGHFLIGRPLTATPEPDIRDIQQNRLSRWEQVQQMSQHFWKRWSSEYVSSLQQRFKWTQKRNNLQPGDLVLIRDENLPPTKWNMARVIETHPGADSLVRVVTLKTSSGKLQRPIAKLCPILPINETTDSN